jgi:RND family efflux transporter MFP subunit
MISIGTVDVAGFHFGQRSSIFLLLLALVTASPATAQDMKADSSEFDCLVQPKMVLKLGTSVPALISEVLVDRGAIVKKGDIVARLESGVEAAAVALAKVRANDESAVRSGRTRVEFQSRKEERTKQLRRGDNVSISTSDEAETAARVAENELDAAEINLKLAQLELVRASELLNQRIIRSPINGVVVERTLGPGEYAYDQSHIMTVSQIDPLNVEVYVPLSQFGRIRPGMSAEVYPEAPVGGRYTAIVVVVDQVFDAASGTIGIRLELPNPDYALPAGLRCRARFPGIG